MSDMERAFLALAYDLHLTPHQVGAMYWPEVLGLLEYKADQSRQRSAGRGNILDMEPAQMAAAFTGA